MNSYWKFPIEYKDVRDHEKAALDFADCFDRRRNDFAPGGARESRSHIPRESTIAGIRARGPGHNGQNVNLCTINWGDRSRKLILAIVDAENTTTVLASRTVTLAPGGEACLPYTNNNAMPGAVNGDPTAVEFVGLIIDLSREIASDENGGRAYDSLAATLELSDGSVRGGPNRVVFLPRVAELAVELLPAVQ